MFYMAGLVVIIYLNIMYPWRAGRVLLAGFLVLPFLCEMLACYLAVGIGAELACEKRLLNEGERLKLLVKVNGKKKIFPAKVKLFLHVTTAAGVTRKETVTVPTDAQQENYIEMKADEPGIWRISVKKMIVRETIGIGSVRKRGRAEAVVTVMPETIPVSMVISNQVRSFPMDSDEFSKTKSGDDVSEVYDVREYRPGDGMQRVHWKLSARQEKLWVKEYSFPLGASVVLFAAGDADERHSRENRADFLRGFVSFSRGLLEHGCTHYAAWEGRASHLPKRFLVTSDESYYEMVNAFLADSAEGFGELIEEQYPLEFPERYCRGLVWEERGVLRTDEKILFEAKPGENQIGRLKDVLIEV